MNRTLIIVAVLASVYFGHRHFAASRAYGKLATVPTSAEGAAGFARLTPTDKLDTYREPGRHTVFIFSAAWCPACHALEANLPRFLNLRPDVAIRAISIDDPAQAAIAATGVHLRSIPHVVIYDADGDLVAQDNGSNKSGYETLIRWVNDEAQKPATPR